MRLLVFVLAVILFIPSASFASELPDDPLLLKPVTLAVKGEAISDVMALISRSTGVRIRVARAIADQKATIFVDEQPAKDVMESVALLFNYEWRQRRAADITYYELFQSSRTRMDAEAKREEMVRRAWQKLDEDMRKTAELIAANWEELRRVQQEYNHLRVQALEQGSDFDMDPFYDKLEQLGFDWNKTWSVFHGSSYPSYLLYGRNPKRITEALTAGLTVCFDSDSPEPEWQIPPDIFQKMIEVFQEEESRSTAFSVRWQDDHSEDYYPNNGLSTELTGTSVSITPRVNPRTVEAKIQRGVRGGKAVSYTNSVTYSISDTVADEEIVQLPQEEGQEEVFGRKISLSADDMVSEAGLTWQSAEDEDICVNRSDLLALLHRKTGIQIVSDHYSKWVTRSEAEDVTVEQVLKGLVESECRCCSSLSGWDGKFALSRTVDTYAADAQETPNRLLRKWREVYRNQGYLPLETIAEIALLEETQVEHLRAVSHLLGLGYIDYSLLFDGAPLRFYAKLTPQQRQQLFNGGLNTESLTPEQQAALTEILTEEHMSFMDMNMPVFTPEQEAELESIFSEIGFEQLMHAEEPPELTPEQEERLMALFSDLLSEPYEVETPVFVPVVGLYKDGKRIDKPGLTPEKTEEGPFIVEMLIPNPVFHERVSFECEVHYPPSMYSTTLQGSTPEEAWESAKKSHPEARKENIFEVNTTVYQLRFKNLSGRTIGSTSMSEYIRKPCFPAETDQ